MITPSSDSRRALADLNGRDVRDGRVRRAREQSASLPGDEAICEPARGWTRSNSASRPSSIVTRNSTQGRSRASDPDAQVENPARPKVALTQVLARPPRGQATVDENSGPPEVDLAQDSDDENMRIREQKRNQPAEIEYNCPSLYFGKPEHGENDPLDQPGLLYTCLMCGEVVRVSGSSRSNLKGHRDGHNQPGKSGAGCP